MRGIAAVSNFLPNVSFQLEPLKNGRFWDLVPMPRASGQSFRRHNYEHLESMVFLKLANYAWVKFILDIKGIKMKRGIMLPPIGRKVEKGKTSFFTVGDLPFLNTTPAAVLYWDKIYAPIAIKGMAPQYDIAVERLVNLGVAESFDLKSENSFSGADIPQMISSYAKCLSELDARSWETWSVMPMLSEQNSTLAAQSSPYLPKSSQTIASIEVQLKNALPVPDRDVPYEDLLEFKLGRRDQIHRLHAELSQVASRYVSVMDDDKALLLALQDVNLAVSDLQRVYEEKWIKKVTKNLTSAFALDGVLPATVTYLAGATLDTAFLAGAGVTIVRSAVSASLPVEHKNNPYSYALEVGKI